MGCFERATPFVNKMTVEHWRHARSVGGVSLAMPSRSKIWVDSLLITLSINENIVIWCFFLCCADLLRSFLRRRQPIQETADLHRENHGEIQRDKKTRSSSSRFRHHRHRLSFHVAGWVWLIHVCELYYSCVFCVFLLFQKGKISRFCVQASQEREKPKTRKRWSSIWRTSLPRNLRRVQER